MSGTHQVYANTARNRRPISNVHPSFDAYRNNMLYPLNNDGSGHLVNRSPRVPTSCPKPSQGRNMHPQQIQLREARLNRFQATYDKDKEAHLVKQKEKERKKIMDKLKRYEGVGELGNNMTAEEMTEEDRCDGYWRARDAYQDAHDQDAIVAEEDRLNREKEEREKKAEELRKKLEKENEEVSGRKLGGNGQYNRERGDHPLLARLSIRDD